MSLIIKPIKTSQSFFFSSTNTSSGASVQGNGIYNNADLNGALNSLSAFQGGNPAILSSNFNDLQALTQDSKREDFFHWLNVISNFIFVGLMGFSLFMAHKNSLEMSRAVDNVRNTKNSPDLELLDRKDTLTLQGLIKTLTNINDNKLLIEKDKRNLNNSILFLQSELDAIEKVDTTLLTRHKYGYEKSDVERLIKSLCSQLIDEYKSDIQSLIESSGITIDDSEIIRAYSALNWLESLELTEKVHGMAFKNTKNNEPLNGFQVQMNISEVLKDSPLEILILNNSQVFDKFFARGLDLPLIDSNKTIEKVDFNLIQQIEEKKQDKENRQNLDALFSKSPS